jgi:hypothetical protein
MKNIPLTFFLLILFNSTITQAQTVPLVKGPLTWNVRLDLNSSGVYGFNAQGAYVTFGQTEKLVLNVTTPQNSAGFFQVTGYGTSYNASNVVHFPVIGSFIPVDAKYKYTGEKPSHYILNFSVASHDISCKLDSSTLSGTCFRPGITWPITYVSGK